MSKQPNTTGGIGRRTYLKVGAAAGAAVGLGGSVPGSVAASEETVGVQIAGQGVSYELTGADGIVDDPNVTFDASTNVSGRNAEGVVDGAVHGYLVRGAVTDLRIEASSVTIGTADLVVGGSVGSTYEVTVDGSLAANGDTDTQVSGGSAEGTLGGDVHRYTVDGAVTDVVIDGQAAVVILTE